MAQTATDRKIVNADDRLDRLRFLLNGPWSNRKTAYAFEFEFMDNYTRGRWVMTYE